MADPQAAALTQLRNIEARTGQPMAALHAALDAAGLSRHGEKRSWLMARFQLGYGDANAVVHAQGQPELLRRLGGASAPAGPAADPLDDLYAGARAPLRPVHEQVMAAVTALGPHEVAPKKGYVSLRRRKQFAMVGPATRALVEVGLNAKGLLPEHPRLKVQPPGGMCSHTLRLGQVAEVDDDLRQWLRAAYDAAG